MSKRFISVVVPEDDRTNKLLSIESSDAPQTLKSYCADAIRAPAAIPKKLTRREEDLISEGSLPSSYARSPSPALSVHQQIKDQVTPPSARTPTMDSLRLTVTATGSSALYRQTHSDTVIMAKPDGQLARDLFTVTKECVNAVWDAEDTTLVFHGPDATTCKPVLPPPAAARKKAATIISPSSAPGLPSQSQNATATFSESLNNNNNGNPSFSSPKALLSTSTFGNSSSGNQQNNDSNNIHGSTSFDLAEEAGDRILSMKESSLFRRAAPGGPSVVSENDDRTSTTKKDVEVASPEAKDQGFQHQPPLVEIILDEIFTEMKQRQAPYYHVTISASAVDIHTELSSHGQRPGSTADSQVSSHNHQGPGTARGKHHQQELPSVGMTDLLGDVLVLGREGSMASLTSAGRRSSLEQQRAGGGPSFGERSMSPTHMNSIFGNNQNNNKDRNTTTRERSGSVASQGSQQAHPPSAGVPHIYMGNSNNEVEHRGPKPPSSTTGQTTTGSGGDGSLARRQSGMNFGRRPSGSGGSFARRGSGGGGAGLDVTPKIAETQKKSDSYIIRHLRCCRISKRSDIDFFVNKLSEKKDPDSHTLVTITVRQSCPHMSSNPERSASIRLLDVCQSSDFSQADRDALDNIVEKLSTHPLDTEAAAGAVNPNLPPWRPPQFSKMVPTRFSGMRTILNVLCGTIPKPNTHLVTVHVASPSQLFKAIPHISKCSGYVMDTMIDKTNYDVEELLRSLWRERAELETEKVVLAEQLGDLDEKLGLQQINFHEVAKDRNDVYSKSFRVAPASSGTTGVDGGAGSVGVDNLSFGGTMQMSQTFADAADMTYYYEGTIGSFGAAPIPVGLSSPGSRAQSPVGGGSKKNTPTPVVVTSANSTPVPKQPRKTVVQMIGTLEASLGGTYHGGAGSRSPSRGGGMSPTSGRRGGGGGRNTPLSPTQLAEQEYYCDKFGISEPVSKQVAYAFRKIGKELDAERKIVQKNQTDLDEQLKQHVDDLDSTRRDNKRLTEEISKMTEALKQLQNDSDISKSKIKKGHQQQLLRLKKKAGSLIKKRTEVNYDLPVDGASSDDNDDQDEDETKSHKTGVTIESNVSGSTSGLEDPQVTKWRQEYKEKVEKHIQHLATVVKANKGAITSEIGGRWAPLTAEARVLESHKQLREDIQARIAAEERQCKNLRAAINTWGQVPQEKLKETTHFYDYCRHLYQVLTVYLTTYPEITDRIRLTLPLPREDPLSLLMRTCRGIDSANENEEPQRTQPTQEHELVLMELRKATRSLAAAQIKDEIFTKSFKKETAAAMLQRRKQEDLSKAAQENYNRTVPPSTEELLSLGQATATTSTTTSSNAFGSQTLSFVVGGALKEQSVQWPEDFEKEINSTLTTLDQRLRAVEQICFVEPVHTAHSFDLIPDAAFLVPNQHRRATMGKVSSSAAVVSSSSCSSSKGEEQQVGPTRTNSSTQQVSSVSPRNTTSCGVKVPIRPASARKQNTSSSNKSSAKPREPFVTPATARATSNAMKENAELMKQFVATDRQHRPQPSTARK